MNQRVKYALILFCIIGGLFFFFLANPEYIHLNKPSVSNAYLQREGLHMQRSIGRLH